MESATPGVLVLTECLPPGPEAGASLTLRFADRQRSRLRVCLDDGREAGLMLPRGTVLRDGDRLRSADGTLLRVRAAVEDVSRASSADPRLLARAAYHLGNRHVLLQVGDGWLAYLHDHVLDGMVAGLGLRVTRDRAPFEPEVGAYGGTHRHAHGDFTPAPFRQG